MARQSQVWKDLERRTAKFLKGRRVSRGDDFGRSDTDVKVDDLPWLKIDCKYRQRHSLHKTFCESAAKYCKEPEDVMLIITKQSRDPTVLVTIELETFAKLLDVLRDHNDKQQ